MGGQIDLFERDVIVTGRTNSVLRYFQRGCIHIDSGADFVKVFPCIDVGGERYIRPIKTALPQVPLIAAGGVSQKTAGNYILAGDWRWPRTNSARGD